MSRSSLLIEGKRYAFILFEDFGFRLIMIVGKLLWRKILVVVLIHCCTEKVDDSYKKLESFSKFLDNSLKRSHSKIWRIDGMLINQSVFAFISGWRIYRWYPERRFLRWFFKVRPRLDVRYQDQGRTSSFLWDRCEGSTEERQPQHE